MQDASDNYKYDIVLILFSRLFCNYTIITNMLVFNLLNIKTRHLTDIHMKQNLSYSHKALRIVFNTWKMQPLFEVITFRDTTSDLFLYSLLVGKYSRCLKWLPIEIPLPIYFSIHYLLEHAAVVWSDYL